MRSNQADCRSGTDGILSRSTECSRVVLSSLCGPNGHPRTSPARSKGPEILATRCRRSPHVRCVPTRRKLLGGGHHCSTLGSSPYGPGCWHGSTIFGRTNGEWRQPVLGWWWRKHPSKCANTLSPGSSCAWTACNAGCCPNISGIDASPFHHLRLGECRALCLHRPPTSTLMPVHRTCGRMATPQVRQAPRSIALRDTRSNAPMPSIESTGLTHRLQCMCHALAPCPGGEGVLKRCGGGLHCF